MQNFQNQLTDFDGLQIIKPRISEDSRGYFMKTFEKESFLSMGITMDVTESFDTKSVRGVVRGLHFQTKYPQAKLVRVLSGEVFDVAVDLRKNSKTFGKYKSIILSDKNHAAFFIPKGFAHGFLTLSDTAVVSYLCDGAYHPDCDMGILYNDPEIGIKWPFPKGVEVTLSERDSNWKTLKNTDFCWGEL